MVTVAVDRAIVYRGKLFMPGEVEVDAKTAEALEARLGTLREREAAPGTGEARGVTPADLPLAPANADGPGTPLDTLGLADDLRELLVADGLDSVEAVASASDERLMVISGIAEGRVRQIREALAQAGGGGNAG